MERIVGLITGGFDPLHEGHIAYIKDAADRCDILYVGVNSDAWLDRKKGYHLMDFESRTAVLAAIGGVNIICSFDDGDDTACDAIQHVLDDCEREGYEFLLEFYNGGDRTNDNTPEQRHFKGDERVRFVFGVGGTVKQNSSSHIVAKQKEGDKVDRNWGHYRVLYNQTTSEGQTKVKELVVQPGSALSMQYHNFRNELWFVAQGSGKLDRGNGIVEHLIKNKSIVIAKGSTHRLINPTNVPLVIIEIQYGEECVEEDIVRI